MWWVLQPLHARGWFQPLTGFLNGLDYLLLYPGMVVARLLGFRGAHHSATADWLARLALSLPLYFWLGYRLVPALRGAPRPQPRPADEPVPRRRFLVAGLRLAAGTATAGLGYALVVEPRWFEVTRRELPVRDLPASLDGLRLVQLTDVHHGPWLSLAYVRQVVRTVNDLEPDLVVLTGDYVNLSAEYIGPVVAELAALRPRIGAVAVRGNHDWYEDGPRTQRELEEAGIPLIDNARRVVTPDRQLVREAGEGLAVCGVGDLWMDKPDYWQALGGLPGTMPRLLLSHNPDVAEERGLVTSGLRVDWMLSGHTHGGQIRVPSLGTPVVPSRYGQKYAQGVVQGPVCPVFVCRGVGIALLPVRCGVRPEVAILELRAASEPAASATEKKDRR